MRGAVSCVTRNKRLYVVVVFICMHAQEHTSTALGEIIMYQDPLGSSLLIIRLEDAMVRKP
jgi:hypothetical protein